MGGAETEEEDEFCTLPILKRVCTFRSEYRYLKKAFAQKEQSAVSAEERQSWREAGLELRLTPEALCWDELSDAPTDAEDQGQDDGEAEHAGTTQREECAAADLWELQTEQNAAYVEGCPTQEGRLQGETWWIAPPATTPWEPAEEDVHMVLDTCQAQLQTALGELRDYTMVPLLDPSAGDGAGQKGWIQCGCPTVDPSERKPLVTVDYNSEGDRVDCASRVIADYEGGNEGEEEDASEEPWPEVGGESRSQPRPPCAGEIPCKVSGGKRRRMDSGRSGSQRHQTSYVPRVGTKLLVRGPHPQRIGWQPALKAHDEWGHRMLLPIRSEDRESSILRVEIKTLRAKQSTLEGLLQITEASSPRIDDQLAQSQELRRNLITWVTVPREWPTAAGRRTVDEHQIVATRRSVGLWDQEEDEVVHVGGDGR